MSESQITTIIVALTPLYPFLFALAAALFRLLVAKMPPERQALLGQVVQTVVQAIEQMGTDLTGPEKKMKAEAMISTILQSLHIAVSPALVDALIESAVYGLNQSQVLTSSTPSADLVGQRIIRSATRDT